MVEGRDYLSGDSFMQTGPPTEGGEDVYVQVHGSAHTRQRADQDFIAAMRNATPQLLAEIRRLRGK
jgi:hypothetical protein